MGFSVSVVQKMELHVEPKTEGGEGEGKECSSFLPHPLPALLLALCFFYVSHSSFFSPKPDRNACYAVYSQS